MPAAFRALAALPLLALLAACGGGDEARDAAPSGSAADAAPISASGLPLPLPAETSSAITEADLRERTRILADDAFEGRGPGQPAGEMAADWIAAEFQRIGLEPAGEDGSWFQDVPMVEQTLVEDGSGLSVRGGDLDGERALALGTDAVIWTKRQAEDRVRLDPSELVFVGYGVVAPEYGWNDYEGVDAEGKTVVMLVNDPGYAMPERDLFNGRAMTYYGRWTYKYEEAARQGAAAALVIHETAPASYPWTVVANSWTGGQPDLVREDGGASRPVIEGWLNRDTAVTLFEAAGLDFEALKAAAAEEGFEAVPMDGLEASGSIAQTVDRKVSRNVAGRTVGTEAPDEHVMVVAHWDHLGIASGEKTGGRTETFLQDEIFNGAVDNATGTAALIEIAEAMAAGEQRRSGLFLAVTLEESGLLGSAYYADKPTVPLDKIVAGVNIDGALPTGPSKSMVVVGYGSSELEDRLAGVLQSQDRTIVPDPTPEAGFFYRSDHISFAKKGVPMLYADGGNDLREGGVARGSAIAQDYTANRYHKPGDEYRADWSMDGFQQDIAALHQLVEELADSDDMPTWYEGNEFEAARKASLAGGGSGGGGSS